MEALGGRGCIALTHSRPRHQMGWVVSVTPRPLFIPGERTPGTHCTGGWVGPRAGLDTEARGKILWPCRGSNPDRPVVQFIVRHYTDWVYRRTSIEVFNFVWIYQAGDHMHIYTWHSLVPKSFKILNISKETCQSFILLSYFIKKECEV
jgi:hypothetical protein